ncbi:hypothetical protein QBC42DRAFT_171749, partial [Cladorrhinum samala]
LTHRLTMSHLAQNPGAIFSPSIARAAASAAKDWSYIDAWLARKFPNRPSPPDFERNPDTLRALLALASANESADEERSLLFNLESSALAQLSSPPPSTPLQTARHSILSSISDSLTREGSTALTALAQLSLILPAASSSSSSPSTTTSSTTTTLLSALPSEIIKLQLTLDSIEQSLCRLETLTAHLASLTLQHQSLSSSLDQPPRPSSSHSTQDDDGYDGYNDNASDHNNNNNNHHQHSGQLSGYHPPPSLAISNLSAQRRIKSLTAKIPELRDRLSALSVKQQQQQQGSAAGGSVSVEQVREEEEIYLGLVEQKRELDGRLAAFAGLPHDLDAARGELEGLRQELRKAEAERDTVFEGLVERESPKKRVGRG